MHFNTMVDPPQVLLNGHVDARQTQYVPRELVSSLLNIRARLEDYLKLVGSSTVPNSLSGTVVQQLPPKHVPK